MKALEDQMQLINTHMITVTTHIGVAEPHIERVSSELTRITGLLDSHFGGITTLKTLHDATLREDIPRMIRESESVTRSAIEAIDGKMNAVYASVDTLQETVKNVKEQVASFPSKDQVWAQRAEDS